jgi:hypothetical protein
MCIRPGALNSWFAALQLITASYNRNQILISAVGWHDSSHPIDPHQNCDQAERGIMAKLLGLQHRGDQ